MHGRAEQGRGSYHGGWGGVSGGMICRGKMSRKGGQQERGISGKETAQVRKDGRDGKEERQSLWSTREGIKSAPRQICSLTVFGQCTS